MDKQKIYEMISTDIPLIEEQMKDKVGSSILWDKLKTKYDIILPEISKVVKVGGKVSSLGTEFDFRPELKKLKEALTTWIWINEDHLSINFSNVNNLAKIQIENRKIVSSEQELNNLLSESMVYILKNKFREKRIGLEKMFDAFERMKTLKSTNKRSSINSILDQISYGDSHLEKTLNEEMRELTRIGNSFSIRHHETSQNKLPSVDYIEYFYFRTLSFVSLVLKELSEEDNKN